MSNLESHPGQTRGLPVNELKQHLPGMLLQGFLARVMQTDKPEDLNFLSPDLFADMSLNKTLLSQITGNDAMLSDVALLREGKFGDIAYDRYRGRDGLKNLQCLILNLPLWPNPENKDDKVSLVNLLQSPPTFLTKKEADAWLAQLPRTIRQMIPVTCLFEDEAAMAAALTAMRAELGTATEDYAQGLMDEIAELRSTAEHQKAFTHLWSSAALDGTFFEIYFKLMQEIISLYYHTEPIDFVVSNHPGTMQTMAAALRLAGRAMILLPANHSWLKRVTELHTILTAKQGEAEKLADFRAWLAVELHVITHELTHFSRRDIPDKSGKTSEDLPHPEEFYRGHDRLLTTPKKAVRAQALLNKVHPVIKDHTSLVAAPTLVGTMEILQAKAPMDLSAAAVNMGDETKLDLDSPPEPDSMDDADFDLDDAEGITDSCDITAGSHITGGATLMGRVGHAPALRSIMRPVALLGL